MTFILKKVTVDNAKMTLTSVDNSVEIVDFLGELSTQVIHLCIKLAIFDIHILMQNQSGQSCYVTSVNVL